jgi:DNA-binding NtrC family response regulator
MRLGATDYVPKDFNPDDLIHSLARVIERRNLLARTEQQSFEVSLNQRQHVLVGKSAQISNLHKTVEKIRSSSANVVILGETGTGKEVVARQIRNFAHDGSLIPFVAVDSSTIQSTTAESQLFGHEKGSFTGADRMTKGIFEEAHGGIVYFDEIGNMPLDIQAKLLRVLQEKEVTRLGSSRILQLDFRVICATNKNLEEMAAKGAFKDDLLQRLNVVPLIIPPLRDRKEDIPLLVEHFCKKQGAENLKFTKEALGILENYSWPGNVRELSNLVAYVVTMVEGTEIDAADLPPKLRDASQKHLQGKKSENSSEFTFYDRVAAFEKEILSSEYLKLEGNVTRLALNLGMDRSHLYTKLKEYRIHPNKS